MNNKHFNEKDYKDVIGCKYGELMILSYTSPLKSYDSMRLCKSGIRNISWSGREQCYVISMKRHGKYFRTRAKTLKEAINEKERMIAEVEEYFQEKIYKKGVNDSW